MAAVRLYKDDAWGVRGDFNGEEREGKRPRLRKLSVSLR